MKDKPSLPPFLTTELSDINLECFLREQGSCSVSQDQSMVGTDKSDPVRDGERVLSPLIADTNCYTVILLWSQKEGKQPEDL